MLYGPQRIKGRMPASRSRQDRVVHGLGAYLNDLDRKLFQDFQARRIDGVRAGGKAETVRTTGLHKSAGRLQIEAYGIRIQSQKVSAIKRNLCFAAMGPWKAKIALNNGLDLCCCGQLGSKARNS